MKAERLLTPLSFLAITLAIVIMPAERSGWNFDSVISFLTAFATTVAIFAVITLGLNVQWGYTGVFNFGIAGFFMVGAYTAAVFTKSPAESEFVRYIGGFGDRLAFLPFLDSRQWLPFVFGTAAAAIMSGALAFALSIPTLRLRADYLAITTIGIAELLRAVVLEERGLVNSARGLIGIPRPFHSFFQPDDYKFVYFGIAVFVLIIVFAAVERGIRSPWGRVLRALREDELTTAASGKNVFGFKMQGFIFGAMIMGIGGSIYAYERGSISPDTFTPFFATFIFWVMLMVGGSGNNKGAILGAYIVWGIWTISLQLQGYNLPEFVSSRIFFIRDLVIGSLIVIVLLLRPAGLLPEERRVSLFIGRDTGPRPREPTTEPEPTGEGPPQ
jgi:branched-chain amino acid transport system permease protein